MENGGHEYICNSSRFVRSNGNGNTNNNNNNTNNNLEWYMWHTNNTSATSTITAGDGASTHALMLDNSLYLQHHNQQQLSLYGGGGEGSNLHPDQHLMCLKLGKRHYFDDSISAGERRQQVASLCIGKRGKQYYSVGGGGGALSLSETATGGEVVVRATAATVPRCQVEGCSVVLVNAKDYHRRHKVCEMHSKAPKVVVLGLEQRFCQQCSRFHVISEFDESKRSCRRRLAGHNERRRKNAHESFSRNSCQEKLMAGRIPISAASTTSRALSLLSSNSKEDSWVSSSDLSSRSSAALRELIAEHRAAILARQLVLDRHFHHNHNYNDNENINHSNSSSSSNNNNNNCLSPYQLQILSEPQNWGRFDDFGKELTLDLMHAPNTTFGLLSSREKNHHHHSNKDEDESCSDLWNTWAGAHM